MSLTIIPSHSTNQLCNFLRSEYQKQTGIPVHLYAHIGGAYHKCRAITDNEGGTIFLEEPKLWKSYGTSNPLGLLSTLRRCGLTTKVV